MSKLEQAKGPVFFESECTTKYHCLLIDTRQNWICKI